ncbi:C-type lectin domain family 4 member K [Tupaia chinensis]|uniref:C-type lectin domain family 4 member K n=1 Tax=Tupaia chinensis TaxID=246437 RepID=UPI0003C8DFD7|nr:C-type lectin domain family 4 member K [Tupaia chinensis]
MGTISDIKSSAQLLKERVDNVSALGPEVKKNSGGVEAAGVQVQRVNASLDLVHTQILMLKTSVENANAHIQILTENWEDVNHLNAQIPGLKKDLDKASVLNTKVRGLQSSLENINKLLRQQEPPSKPAPALVPRRCLTVRTAIICLVLALAASILLQATLYPWFMGTISDIKSSAQLLKERVDNVSALGPEVKKNSGGVEAAGVQVQRVNASLDLVHTQILMLKTSVENANAHIQILTENWEDVNHLNAQIPGLKKDLDKASVLNTKVRGLQSSLENINKLLRQQDDILQMVSQGWRYFQGNFYYFSRIVKTWYSAQQFCLSRGAHLTSVTSEGEQEFLYKTAGGLVHWIGLTKAGTEGDWTWVDDTPFDKVQSKRFWIPGEPNNNGNNEHCANIRVSSLRSWNDAPCDNQFLFICKRPYISAEP